MQNTNPYSKIIAGTMTWGSWGKQLFKKGMIDLMHHCLSLGIYTFDHADIYGGYGNEAAFGEAFIDSGIQREDITLISKCGIQMTSDRSNQVKHYQYDSEYIEWSVEQSLKKLRTDYIDLFLLHRPSPLLNHEEVAKVFAQLGAKYDASESQLLIAFVLKHPAQIHPVVGTTNKERLASLAKVEKIDLELEDWFLLLEASQGQEVP